MDIFSEFSVCIFCTKICLHFPPPQLLTILSHWQIAISRVTLSHWLAFYPGFWLLPCIVYDIFLHKWFFFLKMEATHSPRSVVYVYQGTWSHLPGHNLTSSQYVTPLSSGEYATLTWPVFINIIHSKICCFRAEDSSVNKIMSRKYFELQFMLPKHLTYFVFSVFAVLLTSETPFWRLSDRSSEKVWETWVSQQQNLSQQVQVQEILDFSGFSGVKINSNCLLCHRYWHNAIHEKRRAILYVCNYLCALKLFAFGKRILCYIGVIETHVFYPFGPGLKSWSVFSCFPQLLQIIAITVPSTWPPVNFLLFSPTFDTIILAIAHVSNKLRINILYTHFSFEKPSSLYTTISLHANMICKIESFILKRGMNYWNQIYKIKKN